MQFDSWVGKLPWSRKLQPTLVFLPGKFHKQRSLVGPLVAETDLTECTHARTHTHTHTHMYVHTYLALLTCFSFLFSAFVAPQEIANI